MIEPILFVVDPGVLLHDFTGLPGNETWKRCIEGEKLAELELEFQNFMHTAMLPPGLKTISAQTLDSVKNELSNEDGFAPATMPGMQVAHPATDSVVVVGVGFLVLEPTKTWAAVFSLITAGGTVVITPATAMAMAEKLMPSRVARPPELTFEIPLHALPSPSLVGKEAPDARFKLQSGSEGVVAYRVPLLQPLGI